MTCEQDTPSLDKRMYDILNTRDPAEIRQEAMRIMDSTKGQVPPELDKSKEILGQLGELR